MNDPIKCLEAAASGNGYNGGLGEPRLQRSASNDGSANPYSHWNGPTTKCFDPLDVLVPMCMKLRCPTIGAQIGRTITYTM